MYVCKYVTLSLSLHQISSKQKALAFIFHHRWQGNRPLEIVLRWWKVLVIPSLCCRSTAHSGHQGTFTSARRIGFLFICGIFARNLSWFPPENAHVPKKGSILKGDVIFPPLIFREKVRFKGSKYHQHAVCFSSCLCFSSRNFYN